MASDEMDALLSSLGLALPAAVKDELRQPRATDVLRSLGVGEFAALTHLDPSVPNRFVPTIWELNGDLFGLYFPRTGGDPIASLFIHEASNIAPITRDVERFYREYRAAPDDADPSDQRWYTADHPITWPELMYDFDAETPELQLLRPFAFNERDYFYSERNEPQFERLSRRFGARHGPAGIVRYAFRSPRQALDRSFWLELMRLLADAGHFAEALCAWDNLCAIIHAYPYYGRTTEPGGSRVAADLRDAYRAAARLVATHGDALDRSVFDRQADIVNEVQRCAAERS